MKMTASQWRIFLAILVIFSNVLWIGAVMLIAIGGTPCI